jgi:hypothetical protein
MMLKSVLKVNSGECPLWSVNVSVLGWYKEMKENEWEFLHAECPIIENSKLAEWKQKQIYKGMFCKDRFSCPLYTQFQYSIIRTK